MSREVRFVESHAFNFISPLNKFEGKDWDVVVIETGLSKNGTFYPEKCLRDATSLFENARVCAYGFGDSFDHLPDAVARSRPEGFAVNIVGWLEKARFGNFTRPDGTTGKGIIARLHVLEGAEWLKKNLKDAWLHGKTNVFGLSIDAEGQAHDAEVNGRRVKLVEKIDKVKSTDIVSHPAAGGSLLRLVASLGGKDGMNTKIYEATRLGDFIQAEMDKKEISIAQLARSAGISPSIVTQIIRGEIKRPPDRRLRGFARALGVPFSRLLNLIPEDIRETEEEYPMQELINLIKDYRPQWLKGFSEPDGEISEYLLRVLESNLGQAEEELRNIPTDEIQKLSEVARGVNTLNSVINLLKQGKIQEAMTMLQNWLSAYPMPDARPQEGQKGNSYSFPYKAPVAATAPTIADTTNTVDASNKNPDGGNVMPPKDDDIKKREAELAVKESVLQIKGLVMNSGLSDRSRERMEKILLPRAGKIDEKEIQEAIKDEKEYVASMTGDGKPHGLGGSQDDKTDIKVMQEQHDKYRLSFEAMLAGGQYCSKEDEKELLHVQPFTSIHEAYGQIAKPKRWMSREDIADNIFWLIAAGFPNNPNRHMAKHMQGLREAWSTRGPINRLTEATVTSDFTVTFGDSLFRRLLKEYRREELNDWRILRPTIENLTDATNTMNVVSIGGHSTLPVVAENAAYQELADTTERNEKLTPTKKGGLRKLTWEALLADRLAHLRAIPRVLGRTAARTLQFAVWDLIDKNTVLTSDSVALINSATHSNQVSTDPALSYNALSDAIELLRKQTEQDSGEKLGLRATYLLVGPDKEQEALEITESVVKQVSNDDATTRSFVNLKGIKTVSSLGLGRSTAPDTSKRWWLLSMDGELISVGFLGGRDQPDIFVQSPADTPTAGAAFDADAMTFKIRFVFGTTLNDWRPIVGSLATS